MFYYLPNPQVFYKGKTFERQTGLNSLVLSLESKVLSQKSSLIPISRVYVVTNALVH